MLTLRKEVAQTKPLLVPQPLAATRILLQGGDMPWPHAAWALPLPTPNKRVWWVWAGFMPSWCLPHRPTTRETLLCTPNPFRDCPLALWGSPHCPHSPLWLGVLNLGKKGGAKAVLAVHSLVILSAPD